MKKIFSVFMVVIFATALLSVSAWGQIITFDDFNYADNALLTANGWTAHSGGGTAPIAVGASNGLTYSGYLGSGIGNAAKVVNTGEDDSKTFTAITSGTIYYSFLVNITSGTLGYFIHLGGSSSAFAARVYVQPSATSGKINFYLSNRSTDPAPVAPTDFDTSTTYLLIVKYDVSTTGTCSLWVETSGIPANEAAAGAPEDTSTNNGQASIDRICLRQYSAAQRIVVDGIRVGTTWDDAPLPVELVSFTAAARSGKIELNWTTKTEVNNYGFEIERKSVNDWNKLGFVEGNGTTNAPHNYSFTDNSIASGKYSYRLKQIDRDGKFEYSKSVESTVGITPNTMVLGQNYPNPFNPETNIEFAIPVSGRTMLKVYNMLGEEVAMLVNGNVEAGVIQHASFNGTSLPSGLYFYTLRSGNFVDTKKMMMVK